MKIPALTALFLTFGSAAALAADMPEACVDGEDPAVGIAACTAFIESGGQDPALLSLAHSNRASWNLRAGNPAAVLEDAAIAIQIDPTNWRAFFNRGRALRDAGETERAVADYTRALELAGTVPEDRAMILVDRGNAAYEIEDWETALADYRAANEIDPDPISWQNTGVTLYRLGRYEEAVAAHDEALALDPDHEPSITNRGEALEKLGDFEGAMAAYERAMDLDFEGWAHPTMAYMAERGFWDGPLDAPDSPEFRAALLACTLSPEC